ncbi:ATP-binding protein [Dactylosporangium sp. McL0621]|uniref:ATP-binding protein n=1 Tax=Dactylosporangium sp. McL0621 TaxID=3415678 RepID=UPI003CF60F69
MATRALVAQAFVGMIAIVGLSIALGRDERAELLGRLTAAGREAAAQARLLTTIVDSMSEGVSVLRPDRRLVMRNPAAVALMGGVTRDNRAAADNLVGNAVKYTAPGTVPRIAITSAIDEERLVRVEIADNGIGIPPGQHDAIFTNFHRAHRAAGYAGTGLGLAICKRIVERHGGTIGATDNPGGGSRFTFTLPPASEHARARPAVTGVAQ